MIARQQTIVDRHVMVRVKIFSTETCPFCIKAKQLLDRLNIPYEELLLDRNPAALKEFSRATEGARTVPQIIIDGKCIGGYIELTELHMENRLDGLMQADNSSV
jgi:glutaredoxin 3